MNTNDRKARLHAAILATESRATQASGRLPENLERRYAHHELRADTTSGKRVLSGLACRFLSPSQDLGGFVEQLAPGCFTRCLARDGDIALLSGHDMNAILARQSAGTLDISQDSIGLRFRADLPETTLASDVLENIRCGNIAGMSFGFVARSESWDEVDCDEDDPDCEQYRNGRVPRRTVLTADVFELSTTPFPAYKKTNVDTARALWPAGIPAEIRSHVGNRVPMLGEAESLRCRHLRLHAALMSL
jgi:Escherichia/Staphylococcus phage prohead protease